ncbi:MAG TPA: hypothetical protein VHJ17_07270 [Thermomonospora sp.]|nr:hypothetical protein [Thermomonospora sp.]
MRVVRGRSKGKPAKAGKAEGRSPGRPPASPPAASSGARGGQDRADTAPIDRRAAERARRAAAVRGLQERRRARAGLHRRSARQRSGLLALVLTLGVLIAAVAVTGTLIATSRDSEPVPLTAPLHVYPVTQVVSGACPAGTQGITGQTVSGPACYQLSSGIRISKVTEMKVQRGASAGDHNVAIDLVDEDRRAFGDLTRVTRGRTLAFVVRDQLVTAARVTTPITNGRVVVTGRFSRADADRLVRTLRGS